MKVITGHLLVGAALAGVATTALAEGTAGSAPFDHAHSQWTRVLKKHVTVKGPVSEVAYTKLYGDAGDLSSYLKALSAVSRDEFRKFSRDEQLAFLINAYNAFTVKLILDHYPVDSIKDIGGLFSSPWKKQFFNLLGDKRHLDSIEHGMIRKDPKAHQALEEPLRAALKSFDESRVHFALNCASKGCPSLRGEPYVPSRLDAQLEDATHLFLSDPVRNVFDPGKSELRLSSIFKWYGTDFEKASGSVRDFVARRMARDATEEARVRSAKVTFLDYDWSLNGK